MLITGDMRFSINILRNISTKDVYGAITSNWVCVNTLKATVKYINGSQTVNNSEIFNTNTLQFITHYRDIRTSDVIKYKNIKYNILSIQEIGYMEGLQILAQEINS